MLFVYCGSKWLASEMAKAGQIPLYCDFIFCNKECLNVVFYTFMNVL